MDIPDRIYLLAVTVLAAGLAVLLEHQTCIAFGLIFASLIYLLFIHPFLKDSYRKMNNSLNNMMVSGNKMVKHYNATSHQKWHEINRYFFMHTIKQNTIYELLGSSGLNSLLGNPPNHSKDALKLEIEKIELLKRVLKKSHLESNIDSSVFENHTHST
jgi:hypothetical protein